MAQLGSRRLCWTHTAADRVRPQPLSAHSPDTPCRTGIGRDNAVTVQWLAAPSLTGTLHPWAGHGCCCLTSLGPCPGLTPPPCLLCAPVLNRVTLPPCVRPRNRHYSLATYILLRGITLLIRVGNKERNRQRHPALHALLAPTRVQHGDTILMCAACECAVVAGSCVGQALGVCRGHARVVVSVIVTGCLLALYHKCFSILLHRFWAHLWRPCRMAHMVYVR